MSIRPIVLSEHNILRGIEAMNTGTLADMRVGVRRELDDAIQILTDAYQKKNLNSNKWSFFVAMAETFLQQFHKEEPAVFVAFIVAITSNDVMIRYAEVPAFRDYVQEYGPLLRLCRQQQSKYHVRIS